MFAAADGNVLLVAAHGANELVVFYGHVILAAQGHFDGGVADGADHVRVFWFARHELAVGRVLF